MLGGEYSSRYEEIQLIGRNIQDDSEMFLVKDSQQEQYRMAKKLSLIRSSIQEQQHLLNQVTMLKELSHPHIIRYYDILLEEDCLTSLLQFCEEGDLANYLQKKRQKKEVLSEKLLLSWLMQLLMGLEYIHTKNIIHRLVASQNVYLNHQGDLKIGSFGSAKVLENTIKKAVTVVTAPCNMSPQMVKGQPYSTKADIWALGCLIYEMASFKPLYTYTNLPQLYDLIVQTPSPQLPVKYGKILNPIYKKMMKKSAHQRPSASELLQQQVFVSLMKEYIKKKKIDSLDLKYLVPKKLTVHKNKPKKKQPMRLPPISPNLLSVKKEIRLPKTPKTPKSPSSTRSSRLSSNKTEPNQELRSCSREKRKGSRSKKVMIESPKLDQGEQVNERLTKINEKQCHHISHLCQVKLNQILQKYKPRMDEIYEKTFEFQDFQQSLSHL